MQNLDKHNQTEEDSVQTASDIHNNREKKKTRRLDYL